MKDQMVALRRETSFSIAAATGLPPIRFLGSTPVRRGVAGKRELIAHATFPCEQCGAVVDTRNAGPFSFLAEKTVQWKGVPCACGVSYTVELESEPCV